jgi:type IX secretion system PorP/SprF family membrane protein
MRKYTFYIKLVLLLSSLQAISQSENQYTQFMYNTLNYNPAYAGSKNVPTISLLARNQWSGFEGAPSSQNLNFHSPIFNKKSGMGISISNHKIGDFGYQFLNLSYSYALYKTNTSSLRLGIKGSARRFAFDVGNNKHAADNDPLLSGTTLSNTLINTGAGIYFESDESYLGFSVPNIIENNLLSNTKVASEYRHYYFMGGLLLRLADNFYLKPAALFKFSANTPNSLDLNLGLIFFQSYMLGVSHRTSTNGIDKADSYDLLMFAQISNQLGIGAAYDYSVSPLQSFNNGSFELVVRYNLKKQEFNLVSPRNFF